MRKPTIVILLALLFSTAIAQKKTSFIVLNDSIRLYGAIEKFDASLHWIDTCQDEFSNKYICRIDGKKWYGSDQGLELPRTQLKGLTININNQAIALNVSGMYNPMYALDLHANHFSLERKGKEYYLSGFFSDGAGTYIAHWKISGTRSVRLKISNDEKDFSWEPQ